MKLLDSACSICTRQASNGGAIRNKIAISEKEKLTPDHYQLPFMVSPFWVCLKTL
jgi:hypothetical protein